MESLSLKGVMEWIMSEEEFVPTSLDVVMGGEAVDAPVIEASEPEAVEEEAKPEVTAEPEPEKEPVKLDEADNFSQLREVAKTQKARIEELEAAQKEPVKAPDLFEDQEGFVAHQDQKMDDKIVSISVEMVKEQFSDYEEVVERFLKETDVNPAMFGLIKGKANQALAAYKEGQKLIELDKIGDPVEYRAKIKAELMAEMKAEAEGADVKAKQDKTALKESLPDDLTSESSTGNRAKVKAFKPTELGDIL